MQGMVMILFGKCNQAETYAKKHNRRSSDFHYKMPEFKASVAITIKFGFLIQQY